MCAQAHTLSPLGAMVVHHIGNTKCNNALVSVVHICTCTAEAEEAPKTPVTSSWMQASHFFAMDQRQGQGRVMVLCLAHQLAQRLPGFAQLLASVVEQHGYAAQLDLGCVFSR